MGLLCVDDLFVNRLGILDGGGNSQRDIWSREELRLIPVCCCCCARV